MAHHDRSGLFLLMYSFPPTERTIWKLLSDYFLNGQYPETSFDDGELVSQLPALQPENAFFSPEIFQEFLHEFEHYTEKVPFFTKNCF